MAKVLEAPELDDEEIQRIYEMIDEIPLSRPKRNITRDFADGAMLAEIINHNYPRLVELHNYPQAHSLQQKMTNWNTLNAKVFRKMGFQLARTDIEKVVNCVPDAIEKVLNLVLSNMNSMKDRGVNPVPPPPRGEALAQPKVSVQERLPGQSTSALKEKDMVIGELKETIEIMESKILKLEQLVKLKDSKIQLLTNKIVAAGLS